MINMDSEMYKTDISVEITKHQNFMAAILFVSENEVSWRFINFTIVSGTLTLFVSTYFFFNHKFVQSFKFIYYLKSNLMNYNKSCIK